MTSPSDTGSDTTSIDLSPAIRRAISDLNRRFLRGRVLEIGLTHGGLGRTPHGIDEKAIKWMAACPFTLFEMWRIDSAASGARAEHPDSTTACESSCFEDRMLAQATLILGSHLAESSRLALAMALGPSAIPHAVVRNTPIAGLPEWLDSRHVLRVRWLDDPHFWSTLIDAGRQQDKSLLGRAHCLGLTLLASELVHPDAAIGRGRGRHPATAAVRRVRAPDVVKRGSCGRRGCVVQAP